MVIRTGETFLIQDKTLNAADPVAVGLYRALADFDPAEVAARFTTEAGEKYLDVVRFGEWLCTIGIAATATCVSLELSDEGASVWDLASRKVIT